VLVTPDCKRLETIIHQELLSKNIRGEIFKLTISEILEASRKYTALDDTFIYSGTIELAGESVKIPFLEVFGENSEAKTDESKEKGGFECRKTFDNQNRKVPCDKTITCNECQKCFGNIGKYNMHKRNSKCHKEEESIYKCDKCSKEFTTAKALKQHSKRKIPCDRKLQCIKCGKSFDNMGHLNRHLENRKTPCEPIVGGEAPTVSIGENKCIFCGRDFTTPKRLENHIQKCRIANNKKVYSNGEFKPGMEALADKVKIINGKQYVSLDSLVDFKEELKKEIKSEITGMTINNTFNGPVQINNITISFDGKQALDHLDANKIVELLQGEMHKIIPAITDMVHGDPGIIQNHNVYLPNLKEDRVLVVKAEGKTKKWEARTLREVFKTLMKRGVDVMYKADDELSAMNKLLTDEEGAKFEMLINKQRSNSIYDEDIEEIKPILAKMKLLVVK
jgi:hypothetical protein